MSEGPGAPPQTEPGVWQQSWQSLCDGYMAIISLEEAVISLQRADEQLRSATARCALAMLHDLVQTSINGCFLLKNYLTYLIGKNQKKDMIFGKMYIYLSYQMPSYLNYQ